MVIHWSGDGFGVEERWSCGPKTGPFFEKEGRTKAPSCKGREIWKPHFYPGHPVSEDARQSSNEVYSYKKGQLISDPPFPSTLLGALSKLSFLSVMGAQ